MKKGAAIYEFHKESEFEISSVQLFKELAKKTSSKYVEQRMYFL